MCEDYKWDEKKEKKRKKAGTGAQTRKGRNNDVLLAVYWVPVYASILGQYQDTLGSPALATSEKRAPDSLAIVFRSSSLFSYRYILLRGTIVNRTKYCYSKNC